jgi:hypothetical protein
MSNEATLTYKEFASRMGIKLESARKTVQRHGWKRLVGTDGRARILVPADYLPPDPDSFGATNGPQAASARNGIVLDVLKDALRQRGEKVGPILAAALVELEPEALKALLLRVASSPAP